tara:strand:- start:97 stop:252 length:156 start_codon:yes stop_codon:yes gene_type:complete
MDTFYVICRGNPGIFISFLSSEKKKVWEGGAEQAEHCVSSSSGCNNEDEGG